MASLNPKGGLKILRRAHSAQGTQSYQMKGHIHAATAWWTEHCTDRRLKTCLLQEDSKEKRMFCSSEMLDVLLKPPVAKGRR